MAVPLGRVGMDASSAFRRAQLHVKAEMAELSPYRTDEGPQGEKTVG